MSNNYHFVRYDRLKITDLCLPPAEPWRLFNGVYKSWEIKYGWRFSYIQTAVWVYVRYALKNKITDFFNFMSFLLLQVKAKKQDDQTRVSQNSVKKYLINDGTFTTLGKAIYGHNFAPQVRTLKVSHKTMCILTK